MHATQVRPDGDESVQFCLTEVTLLRHRGDTFASPMLHFLIDGLDPH
jgi:hypothetical protein